MVVTPTAFQYLGVWSPYTDAAPTAVDEKLFAEEVKLPHSDRLSEVFRIIRFPPSCIPAPRTELRIVLQIAHGAPGSPPLSNLSAE